MVGGLDNKKMRISKIGEGKYNSILLSGSLSRSYDHKNIPRGGPSLERDVYAAV